MDQMSIDELSCSWSEIGNIALYGFGRQGKTYIAQLENLYHVAAIIDNGKAGGNWHGIPILSYEEFLRSVNGSNGTKVVVTSSGRAREEIVRSLLDSGRREMLDFMDADMFLVVSNWFQKKKVLLGRVAIPVTERCTLHCEKCMVSVPYIKDPRQYPFEQLKNDADILFSKADYVGVIQIFGGEPYLNKDLASYIDYLEEHYKKRIGVIQIISNATILPPPELLEQLQSNSNIDIRFSDYTGHVPYSKKFNAVLNLLRSKNIPFNIERFDWLDMGHPLEGIQIGKNAEEAAAHMFNCSGRCQTFCEGRYWFCSRAWGAWKAYGIELEQDSDFLDLAEASKDELVRFHVGLMDNGYSGFCNRCRGFDLGLPIEHGVQLCENNYEEK